jgi:hypothetical protein
VVMVQRISMESVTGSLSDCIPIVKNSTRTLVRSHDGTAHCLSIVPVRN